MHVKMLNDHTGDTVRGEFQKVLLQVPTAGKLMELGCPGRTQGEGEVNLKLALQCGRGEGAQV